jgi:hypothetical protein
MSVRKKWYDIDFDDRTKHRLRDKLSFVDTIVQ